MKTALASPDQQPFNIRECPIWAIPQLAWLGREEDVTLVYFSNSAHRNIGYVVLHVEGQGYYDGVLFKENMNKPGPIDLVWVGVDFKRPN